MVPCTVQHIGQKLLTPSIFMSIADVKCHWMLHEGKNQLVINWDAFIHKKNMIMAV